jgi:hypothetical protein
MTFRAIHFVEEPRTPESSNFWPRLLLTTIFVSAAASAHILFGFRLF